ncbi:histidine kinase N-terminal 7TM domain-containing protein [Haloarcula nitratireducens]|uniref:Histidine kinase n=1 Tax=Haloarcula nitratireducens TaxID=2487749 RepID=A0AAW4PAW0_9EURY|nr:histidine kinase N-terminal 7TM domain-containing protein [Halomicroarcula nitratireducens]MBX0295036.1 histidine kinase [Halomicroarcula nitratireducens]
MAKPVDRGRTPFGWLIVAAGGWCFLKAAWLLTTDQQVAATLFLLVRLTSGAMVGLWVVFALTYTGRREWLTPVRVGVLLVIPSGYALLALTNPLHGFVVADVTLVTRNGLSLFVGRTGTAYAIQTAISFGFIGAGYVLFGEFLLRSRNLYRKQTFAVLTGGILTAGAHALFVLGATPHPGINPAPLTFALNGLLVGVALFRYDFLTVAPLAGDLLVDELPDPVLVLDTEGTVIDYNAAATAELGGDLNGARLPEEDPRLLAQIERGESFTASGTQRYYAPQTSEITDQHGAARGRLVVLRNVTGQRRRQDRLEALQAATREFIEADQRETVAELTVAFATSTLDQNAAGVFLSNERGHLEPTALSDAVEAQVDDDLLYVDPAETPDRHLWRTYESGERRVASFVDEDVGPLETSLMLPLGDHGVVAIGSEGETYATEDEQYAEILARTTQVALEQVERERELRESRASVERRNEQIEFFNGVLRHSLRNAMLVVGGRAEHLREHVPPDQRRHVDSIEQWCEKLTAMSETIRDINETVAASEGKRLETVDLSAAVRRAVETTGADYPDATITLDVGETRVLANGLAEAVLTSVVENALEHNAGDPCVEITTRDAGDWIQVHVADDGRGISDELKATVFQRSLTPNQTAGGFGLYFVTVMMDLYGGNVWFEDNHPTGTVAVLEFQRASDDGSATATDETAAADAGAETQGKSPDDW